MLIQPIDYFLVAWFALAAASTLYVGFHGGPFEVVAATARRFPPRPASLPIPSMSDPASAMTSSGRRNDPASG